VLLKGLKEPQTSQFRAQSLRRLLREIEEFKVDLENPIEVKWSDQIRNFRAELERILPHGSNPFTRPTGPAGIQPGSTEHAGPSVVEDE
jgi:hypothetical protein